MGRIGRLGSVGGVVEEATQSSSTGGRCVLGGRSHRFSLQVCECMLGKAEKEGRVG